MNNLQEIRSNGRVTHPFAFMKLLPAALLFSLLALPVPAAPVDLGRVKLRDGRQLEEVKMVKVEPDGLRLEHRDGAGKVRLEDLPSDLSRRFSLDQETASAWRLEEKKRLDDEAGSLLRAKVRVLMEASRAGQEAQARAQRLSIFDQARAGNVNYAALDEQLLTQIQLWNDAGRGDLAARFEEDRSVLKQQEIARPAAALESEKQALARRVESLQSQVNNANNRPATTTVVIDSDQSGRSSYDPYYSSYYQRPDYYYQRPSYYVPGPVIINQSPYCPPTSRPSASYPSPVVRTLQKMPQAARPMTPGQHNQGYRPFQK